MSGFVAFVLLVTGMGVGTLLCGLLPLSLPLSHRMMRVLEVFGAGLLVGAAVTVVIPEGASSLFSHLTPAPAEHSAFVNVLHPPSAFEPAPPLKALQTGQQVAAASVSAEEPWAWSFISKRAQAGHDHDHDHDHEKPFTQSDAEHRLGSSILFGIVLMYVIDQFTSAAGNSSSSSKEDNSGSNHHHHHHNEYAAPSQRPRLETHRLSKSFHQKADNSARPNTLHKVSSKASFTVFDRAQHGFAEEDEEAQLGAAGTTADPSARADPHRRIDSIATTSSNSDTDLPADYDDHDTEHYQHADLKRVSSSQATAADRHASPRSSTTLHRDTTSANHDSSSAGAPLLHRHNSFTSVTSRRTLSSNSSFSQALTTIVGLLIHATADGIAMGASAQSGDQTLTMVVFVAIMIHKAPAAVGLCAMLMSQRLSRTSIRKGVAVFALASPLGAILTYALLALFFDSGIVTAEGGAAASAQGAIDATSIGTALAFSGGTFLFVAFHAVLELAGVEADTIPKQGEEGETQILGKWLRIALLIGGACTPRLLQSVLAGLGGGGHHH